jgi:hypothetical protein
MSFPTPTLPEGEGEKWFFYFFVPAVVSKPRKAVAGFLLYLRSHSINNSNMTDLEMIRERFKIQEAETDILKIKIEALEAVLKNHVPNFEEQYARIVFVAQNHQQNRLKENHDRHSG